MTKKDSVLVWDDLLLWSPRETTLTKPVMEKLALAKMYEITGYKVVFSMDEFNKAMCNLDVNKILFVDDEEIGEAYHRVFRS